MYINYKTLSAKYDTETHDFQLSSSVMQNFLQNGKIEKLVLGGQDIFLSDYKDVNVQSYDLQNGRKLAVTYCGGSPFLPSVTFNIILCDDRVIVAFEGRPEAVVHFKADLAWGCDPKHSTFAMCLDRLGNGIRTAFGPAVSTVDNILFDRNTDCAISFSGADQREITFNWQKNSYEISMLSSILGKGGKCVFKIYKNFYENMHSMTYKPINKKNQFSAPPVGFMTWYALKFETSEKSLLENVYWQSEHLKEFGANCVWVDWEWQHSDMSGSEKKGIDTFNPNKIRYPKGLAHISDEIKKCGFVPALWVGVTNDVNENVLLKQNPDWVLKREAQWCGQWWIDPSHPDVVKKYISDTFHKFMEWGYEAFKWDCLPMSLKIYDENHKNFCDQTKTSEEALRDLIVAARKIIGNEKYMMSCSGETHRDITFAMDLFDGGRIGGDVFTWNEFIEFSLKKILRYICFNNIVLYTDADNVVLRKEFNTLNEAISRASLISAAGLPYTFGDDLTKLEEERVEILKRNIPVLDIHPMDAVSLDQSLTVLLTNLSIAKEFENWNIVNIFNVSEEDRQVEVNLQQNLYLKKDTKYLVYEFWKKEFLGIFENQFDTWIEQHQTKTFCVREYKNIPQIVSTSRHITQGGLELNHVTWEGDTLRGNSNVVKGDSYRIVIYADGYEIEEVSDHFTSEKTEDNLFVASILPDRSGDIDWEVKFKILGE